MLHRFDQGQALLQSAPQHQLPEPVMQQVVLLLLQVAQALDHDQYTVLRYPDQAWLTVQTDPTPQHPQGQAWIPAYGHPQEAALSQVELGSAGIQLQLEQMGIVDLLFLCLGVRGADGFVFYDSPGDRQSGKTVTRTALQQELNRQLQTLPHQQHPSFSATGIA
jgi:hypothetical protein